MSDQSGPDNSGPVLTTVTSALKNASARFQAAGLDTPQLDARLLLQHVMRMDHSALISANEHRLSSEQSLAFNECIEKRLERQPVHRIIGEKEFWGLKLKTSDAVLDPRADTECLVENILSGLGRSKRKNEALRIADIGTGSGAIALALLSELPNAEIVATDISADVLKIAAINAEYQNFTHRISFRQGSYFEPLSGTFDLIVSNPPYISTSDIEKLEPEVRDNDPKIALDGGIDGLDAYRCLLAESACWLRPQGMVYFEFGFDQASALIKLAAECGWKKPEIIQDYGGNDRVFAASH